MVVFDGFSAVRLDWIPTPGSYSCMIVVSDVVPVVGCDWIPIPGANSDSDPVDRSRIPIRRIPLGFLNPVIRGFPIGSLSNLMGFDRNPMGSDRFRSDPIVGLIDLGI